MLQVWSNQASQSVWSYHQITKEWYHWWMSQWRIWGDVKTLFSTQKAKLCPCSWIQMCTQFSYLKVQVWSQQTYLTTRNQKNACKNEENAFEEEQNIHLVRKVNSKRPIREEDRCLFQFTIFFNDKSMNWYLQDEVPSNWSPFWDPTFTKVTFVSTKTALSLLTSVYPSWK